MHALLQRLPQMLIALAAVAALGAQAQDYPTKAIRFIAPIPPGGSTEVLARDVAQKLSERWGQPVVVENRPGGAGSIGSAVVAHAPGDGYTILLVNSSHSINPHVYKSLPFDALKDFAPVSLMTDLPMGVFVNPSVPAKTLAELVALMKAQPGKFSFATSGNGGAGHLTGQMFMQQTGTQMVHVPYRGSALAVNDVVAGQVPVLLADAPVAAPHVRSGALRALAVTSAQRIASMPDVPTFEEAGVKGMDLSVWIGVLTSAQTPPAIVKKLSDTIAAILKEPAMAERVRGRGFNIVASTPEEFAAVIRKDYDRFGEVVRATGVKAE
ncbi:Bug family tripartite tricarboxylate transporter substrate binding protein [Pseudorhodoferax sp.]|uniref:Bug family tripartite tricarboxylate transporter substrate binding protein n=1 Tax=Pseudorhodoferax sp. TaxID=1993553 RepID=UPI002DD660B4|nr:tripartite tricarboxylate transporter substrate binding protein [Pseudorhodoferax sp.]